MLPVSYIIVVLYGLFRHNPQQGGLSGRQLGDAAHRLVANSLQLKTERNGYDNQYPGPQPHTSSRGPPYPPYENNRHHGREQYRMAPPASTHLGHSSESHHYLPHSVPVHHQFDHSYGLPYASSAAHHNPSRHRPPLVKGELPVDQGRDYPPRGYYPSGPHPNGHVYQQHAPHHVAQRPPTIPAGAQFYQQGGGYNNRGNYQSYSATDYHHQSSRGGAGAAPANPNPRGHSRPQHFGNQFSALDRGTSRRPPPGYRQ